MKYKVGDRVKIKEDLIIGRKYGAYYFINGMTDFLGKTTTIRAVCDNAYALDIDNNGCYWTDEMLESAEFTKKDLKPGDILTARNGGTFTINKNGKIINEYGNPIYVETTNNTTTDFLDDNLKNTGRAGSEFDIMKVERPKVIWERPEEKTNEELHREMWNWLAENPTETKEHWCENHGYTNHDYPSYHCFACEECKDICNKCPLDSRVIGCQTNGLYIAWHKTTDIDTKKQLAKVIANLPWKKVDEK